MRMASGAPRRGRRQGRVLGWVAATLLGGLCALAVLADGNTADAQTLSTLRLEIRKTEVVDKRYHLYFSFLDANQRAITNLRPEALEVLLADRQLRQKPLPIGSTELSALQDTGHAVAVMFVVANYRAFTNTNSNAMSAVSEFITKMRSNDVAGMVYYGDSYRDLPFTYDMNSLSEQVSRVQPSKEAIPRLFAALGNGVRRMEKELDVQKVDKRYLVLITDGHGTWEGASQPQAVDNKIKQTTERFKELNITPIVIGYSPTLGENDPGLAMLQQLAVQGGGTYRGPLEKDELFGSMEASYDEIYKSYVLSFKNSTLQTGQNHKLRVQARYKGLEAKSPPANIYVPTPEGIPTMYYYIGAGICLLLGLFGVIGLFAWLWWKKRKEVQEIEDGEFDYDEPLDENDEFAAANAELAGPSVPVGVMGGGGMMIAGSNEFISEAPQAYIGRLEVTGGPLYGRIYFILDDTATIGSADENDIQINDATVSARHAGIRYQENRFELHDFGATNGVFVNGARVSELFLKKGDKIRVGNTEMTFDLPEEA